MRFVCSPTPKSALPCATRSSDSSGTVGTRMDSSSPSSRKNPFSFAATIGRWSGFRNHSNATVTHCVLLLPIYIHSWRCDFEIDGVAPHGIRAERSDLLGSWPASRVVGATCFASRSTQDALAGRRTASTSGLLGDRTPTFGLSHRPRLLVPCHLPEHPLIPRADNKRLLQTYLLALGRLLRPHIHLPAHPLAHLRELRRRVEQYPVTVRMRLGRLALAEQMLAHDAIDPGAGESHDRGVKD